MGRFISHHYPWLWGIVAATGFAVAFWARPLPSSIVQAFSSTIDVGAITVGFLTTAKTVLLSLQSSRAIQQLKSAGVYESVIRNLLGAIRCAFLVAITSMMGLVSGAFVVSPPPEYAKVVVVVVGLWVGLLVMTALACNKIIHLFSRILLIPEKRSPPASPVQNAVNAA